MKRPEPPAPLIATKAERGAEDAAWEAARRAILYNERPIKPPSEIELLRREVRELKERLRIVAEVLIGEHDCGEDDW